MQQTKLKDLADPEATIHFCQEAINNAFKLEMRRRAGQPVDDHDYAQLYADLVLARNYLLPQPQPVRSMRFTCPKCSHQVLEEIVCGATVTSEILDILIEEPEAEYGKQDTESGDVERYQCAGCGFVIKNGESEEVFTLEGLVEWLKLHEMIGS